MFEAYNAVLRNVIRDLPTSYQNIVTQANNATHDCSILALGSCNVCSSYLAFRYGNITLIHAPTDEFNFVKELSLSFHAACSFIKDRHITSQIRRTQENKAQILRTLPRETSNAPCARQHMDNHQCPVPPPCLEAHLSEHTCPECEEEHLADHQCPDPSQCEQEHLADHTCPTECQEPHLANHQCPVITRDPLGHVCYHLECLGPCRVNPSPHVPQENISSIPGAFHSFSMIANGLDSALETIREETPSEAPSSSHTVQPSPTPVTTDSTICPNCQHQYSSRHHRHNCPEAVPRSPSPVFSEPETTTSMSSNTRRVVRHRRRVRNSDGSYTFDGRRLPLGMNRPFSIRAEDVRNISNLDHSESSEEEVEPEETEAQIEEETQSSEIEAEITRPVTPPQLFTSSPLFGPAPSSNPDIPVPSLPTRSTFTRNPEFQVAQPDGFIRNPTLRDFAPPRNRPQQATPFGLQSPAPSSSSSSSGLFSAIPSFAEFQATQASSLDPQAHMRQDLADNSD